MTRTTKELKSSVSNDNLKEVQKQRVNSTNAADNRCGSHCSRGSGCSSKSGGGGHSKGKQSAVFTREEY
jgi:hypothetical protein